MARILPATCVNGAVTVSGHVVDAEILSQGTAESSGVVIIDHETVYYIANTQDDLSESIDELIGIIDQISACLTALDGVSTSPGSAAAAIALVSTLKTAFEAKKDMLR